ncbi:GIY-YIG nuclease family protein [Allopontixanthobacter confluentis]|uniref:GIY-YIG nuclease family protein n=1 Tax=Allopontixanthobacter confluentis TaxID=1849021 RepID=UPI001E56C0BE|nr:GIY-YIG nuclease family protein [Allopontixanthobacter confluentis]
MGDALKRSEPKCTGVYLLLGDQDGTPFAYIGESDDVGGRLKSHDVKKDWWNSVVFITTAGNKLNKAHVRYLESRLIAEAKRIGRAELDNGTTPPVPSLSEADVAKMEAFIENLLTVLPAVRVDMFIERTRPTMKSTEVGAAQVTGSSHTAPRFVLETKKHGLRAHAFLENGEFVVEAGSLARLNWEGRGSEATGYGQLHAELKRSGVLKPEGQQSIFTENYAFKSPSAAAAVVNGRPANGTIEWKNDRTGETYKEWEVRDLEAGEQLQRLDVGGEI